MLMNQRTAYHMAEAIAAREMKRQAVREKRIMKEDGSWGDLDATTSDVASEIGSIASGPSSRPHVTRTSISKVEEERRQKRLQYMEQVEKLLPGIHEEKIAQIIYKSDLQSVATVHSERAKARHLS